ncbi:zinc finger, C4 type [Cooperia oncophora]
MFQYPTQSMDIPHFPLRKEGFNVHQYAPLQNYVNPPSSPTVQYSSLCKQIEISCNSVQNCQVCTSTLANGLHFGARTCAACAAFFRRTISDGKRYVCKQSQRCNNPTRDGETFALQRVHHKHGDNCPKTRRNFLLLFSASPLCHSLSICPRLRD